MRVGQDRYDWYGRPGATLCRDPAQPLRERDVDRGSVNRDQLPPPELSQGSGYGLAGAADEIPQIPMRQRHSESHLWLADRLGSCPLQEHTG